MNNTSRYFLNIVTCALNEEKTHIVPKDIDWDLFLNLAVNHGLVCLIGSFIDEFVNMPDTHKNYIRNTVKTLKIKEKFRNIYIHELLEKLEEHHLYSMPLKGFVIKNYYPKAYMREMNDIDILIDEKQLDDVKNIMEENGYVYDHSSTHEIVYNLDPFINIELHIAPFAKFYKGICENFEDIWERTIPVGKNIYQRQMSIPDLYIHSLTHFAMHYGMAGGGIKPVIDLWLIKKQIKTDEDIKYIESKLEKLCLRKFESVISHLSKVWFENQTHTAETLQTEKLMLSNSSYGSTEDYTMLRFYRLAEDENRTAIKKLKVLFSVIFMKPTALSYKYDGMRKRPYLYPFYTVYRWFDILKNRSDEVKTLTKVTFKSNSEVYNKRMQEVIENNKMMGFKKDFFDEKFYD